MWHGLAVIKDVMLVMHRILMKPGYLSPSGVYTHCQNAGNVCCCRSWTCWSFTFDVFKLYISLG